MTVVSWESTGLLCLSFVLLMVGGLLPLIPSFLFGLCAGVAGQLALKRAVDDDRKQQAQRF